MWNRGAAATVTSVPEMPGPAVSMLTAFHSMLSWVSTAPLGTPVVPEVYMITHGSPPATGTRARRRRGRALASSTTGIRAGPDGEVGERR